MTRALSCAQEIRDYFGDVLAHSRLCGGSRDARVSSLGRFQHAFSRFEGRRSTTRALSRAQEIRDYVRCKVCCVFSC